MAISRHHIYYIAPALVAQPLAIVTISYGALMAREVGPAAFPEYARDHYDAWLVFMGFWLLLFLITTIAGLLVTRPRYVWLPAVAILWQLYYFANSSRILADHFAAMSELFSIRASDLTSPIFLPFVTVPAAAVIVIPTLALRTHQLLCVTSRCRAT